MGRRSSTLTPSELNDLIDHVALYGANYEKYEQWAERNGLEHKFTPGYLKNWIQRRRDLVRAKRGEFEEEVKQASVMTRGKRLVMLEESLDRIHVVLMGDHEKELSVDEMTKIADQERKLMQAIAIERGEWQKAPPSDDELEDKAMNRGLGSEFAKLFDKAAKK